MKNTMKSLKEIKTEMKKINKILIAFSLVFAMSCDTESLLTEEVYLIRPLVHIFLRHLVLKT